MPPGSASVLGPSVPPKRWNFWGPGGPVPRSLLVSPALLRDKAAAFPRIGEGWGFTAQLGDSLLIGIEPRFMYEALERALQGVVDFKYPLKLKLSRARHFKPKITRFEQKTAIF